MTATRQDAWSEDDDLLLAEVILRHIREGSTQLAAFEEVGYRLGRTAAACGFRWNSMVRKSYESAIQIAKAQRQQLKSKGKRRFIPAEQEPLVHTPSLNQEEILVPHSSKESLSYDDVIRFLRQQKDNEKKWKNIDKKLAEKTKEIERLQDENEKMRKELDSTQNEYQNINDDYKSLIKIMDRARKLAFLADDDSDDKMSFKMDKNGNLQRVEKS